MSLSEREQRALDSIEDQLAGSSPKLASLLATFTRLAADEAPPAREKLPTDCGRRCGRRRSQGGGARRTVRRHHRLRLEMLTALIWLVLSLAMISVALTLNGESSGSRFPCPAWASTCTMQTHRAAP